MPSERRCSMILASAGRPVMGSRKRAHTSYTASAMAFTAPILVAAYTQPNPITSYSRRNASTCKSISCCEMMSCRAQMHLWCIRIAPTLQGIYLFCPINLIPWVSIQLYFCSKHYVHSTEARVSPSIVALAKLHSI
jgi:hypothetical protein